MMVHGRRWTTLAVASCLTQLGTAPAHAQARGESPCGTYEYVYPYNTEQLTENHFIVLDCSGATPRGWYYGTSDDFDPGREGYLPGFFVVAMTELTVSERRLSFTLQVSPEEYFTAPIPLEYRGAGDVPAGHFERWPHGRRADPRAYEGVHQGDSIVVRVGREERVFSRVARE